MIVWIVKGELGCTFLDMLHRLDDMNEYHWKQERQNIKKIDLDSKYYTMLSNLIWR